MPAYRVAFVRSLEPRRVTQTLHFVPCETEHKSMNETKDLHVKSRAASRKAQNLLSLIPHAMFLKAQQIARVKLDI